MIASTADGREIVCIKTHELNGKIIFRDTVGLVRSSMGPYVMIDIEQKGETLTGRYVRQFADQIWELVP